MSKFTPNKQHSRTALFFSFHLKKTAGESYRLLRESYGEYDTSQDTRELWFRRFKRGNFEVTDKEHGKHKKSEEQTGFNRLQEMGKIQKSNRWLSYELNDRQMEN